MRGQKSNKATLIVCICLATCYSAGLPAVSTAEDQSLFTVFYEDFSGHGGGSGKPQPDEWANPAWNMPRTSDDRYWIMALGWYGPNPNKDIARQGLMGNVQNGRRVWATTRDFKISPDPVTDDFVLTLKILSISYAKGAMNLRLTDDHGNGYGLMLAIDSPSSKEQKWTNRLVRWDAGKDEEIVLAEAKGENARLPHVKEGQLLSITLRLTVAGILTLEVDDRVIARAKDTTYRDFFELGVSVEYETRFIIDDIKLQTSLSIN